MTDDEIKGLLQREIKAARSNDDTELAANRRKALEYYSGEMKDMPAEAGRSSVVSRDVADTVGWMLPSLMRVFCASDRIVMAEPVGDEDDALAQEATDGLNHIFWKDNPGYKILRDATWDSLVLKNAVVKVYNDDTPEYSTSFHSGLSDEQVAELEADDEVEITHQTTKTETVSFPDPMTGSLIEQPLNVHEVKIKRLKSKARRKIVVIPPEDYFQDEEAVTTEEARFKAHRSNKTRSDLIAMGFDRKTVMDLGTDKDDDLDDHARGVADDQQNDIADKSMETVELFECYLKADVDDDGMAETIRAYYAGTSSGGELLDWEVWEDEGPFYDIPCDPIPHRWDGNSIADETSDIQRVKTAMWRQFNDNVYASNNPQRFAVGDIINPDELFSPSFGGTVFGKLGSSITPLQVPMVADQALAGMTYADEVSARRTGVNRQSMALDPEALQNQSATANQNNKDAAYTQVEQIARDMAELGWKPIFRALLRLEIKHQDRERLIRMGGKPIRIDPRHWNADMDITVNVGLGTGSRDRDMLMLRQVLETQIMMTDRFMGAGAVDDAIDMLPKILSTLVKMAESAGLRNPADYYPEYTDEKVGKLKQLAAQRAQQPNPEVVKEQAKAQTQLQLKQMDVQAQGQKEQLQAQFNTAEKEMAARYQAQIDALQAQYADAASQREYQFKYTELAQKREIELLKLGMVEKEDGTGGTVTVDNNTDAIMQTMQQFGATLATLAASMNAPTEIIRDPASGRAIGARKVTQ